jgi:hypothetical protein
MPVLSTLGAAIANVYGFTSGLIKDTYFNLVSLLLPGNGTNGAQNNTFLDGSSNNFTITRNGDTTQGTFSPFSQTGWGAYFDGSNDYVATSANNLSMQFGTGSYTVECWIYQTARNSNGAFFIGGSGSIFQVSINATGYLESSLAGVGSFTASTSTVPLNSWTHIALVRSSTSTNGCTYYINGNASGTYTDSNNHSSSTSTINIGTTNAGSSTYVLSGYISNMRIAKSAYYTSNFTPSITPLTTTSQGATNVTLLSLQNNRFIDNAATPNTLTPNNGVAITPFSPFAPTQSYSASAVGGSGYFDGSGDYLTIADTTELELGSSNFTIEAWIYPTATPGASGATIIGKNSATYPGGYEFNLVLDNARTISFNVYTTTLVSLQGTTVLPLNAWTHVAASRSGNDYAIYVNGSREDLDSAGGTIQATSSSIYIGEYGGGGRVITGYISSLRVVKGSYVYNPSSTSVTIPTTPLTAITDTKLLLNFTNAGVVDATAKNVLETVGNAQISTSVSKFGGGSISFDGTSNTGLKAPTGNLFTFGSGAFTIEFWVRFNSVAADQMVLNLTGTTIVLAFYVSATGTLSYYLSSDGSTWNIVSGALVGSISTGQWYRVALVRSGNTFTPYLNTTAGTPTTSSAALATPGSGTFLHLGMSNVSASNLSGYLDDVRVTRGVARDMTVLPTAPFPVQ